MPWLTLVTFTPLVGLLVILAIDGRKAEIIRALGLLFSALACLLSIAIALLHNSADPSYQFVERHVWIPDFGIHYFLGVDGISVPMVLLTGILGFIAALASWNITLRVKEYWIFYLLLQVGMFGTFVALDVFLFYIFWELVLVPMYFLIGIWGGARREYAALKFFLYTLAGSVFMLIAFLALYFYTSGPRTFSLPDLVERSATMSPDFQTLIFLGLFLGFAVKVPVWPFHTWLPDAHVEAPTPISVILAGVLLKMGTYGFFRFSFPLCPAVAQNEFIMYVFGALGVIGIIYGAFVALAQRDFKKLVAYSSVSHMGFVLLGLSGLTIIGFSGAYFMTFSHGIISGALFLLVGVLYDRTHTRDLDAFGGLLARVPVYGGILILFAMGSLGLPLLSGFIAEFLVLLGSFARVPSLAALAGIGIVMTAAYTLVMLRRILYGPLNEKWAELPDISRRELWTLIPLAAIMIVLGLYPRILTNTTDPSLSTNVLHIAAPTATTPMVNEALLAATSTAAVPHH